jgi:hypothetical protein
MNKVSSKVQLNYAKNLLRYWQADNPTPWYTIAAVA